MFYIPERLTQPKQRYSLKFITKLESHHILKPLHQEFQSLSNKKYLRKRFKTLNEELDRSKKASLPCRTKKSVVLPQIGERRFILKGKMTGQVEERKCKISIDKTDIITGRKSGRQSRKNNKKAVGEDFQGLFYITAVAEQF